MGIVFSAFVVGIVVMAILLMLSHKEKEKMCIDYALSRRHWEKREREALKRMSEKCDRRIKEADDRHKTRFTLENVSRVSQSLSEHNVENLLEIINQSLTKTFSKMTQEFVGKLEDFSSDSLLELEVNLINKIWDAFQNYKVKVDQMPTMFPEGTRVAYTKGSRTIVLIEQKPQVRTISFRPELIDTEAHAAHSMSPTGNYRCVLAFPYVYFLMVFEKGHYHYQEVYFRNKPLLSTCDELHLAPLPNVWRAHHAIQLNRQTVDQYHAVCMGVLAQEQIRNAHDDGISAQCAAAISAFWQVAFNSHLGNGPLWKIDQRISNYGEWERNSQADPLFILSVDWGSGESARDIFCRILDQRNMFNSMDLVESEVRNYLEVGVKSVLGKLLDEVELAKNQKVNVCFDKQAITVLDKLVTKHTEMVCQTIEQ